MENIRAKIKRRFSHKDKHEEADYDADSADEETVTYVNKDIEDAEKDESAPSGRPNSLLNRLISHGNKKTDDEIARDLEEYNARQGKQNATVEAATSTEPRQA